MDNDDNKKSAPPPSAVPFSSIGIGGQDDETQTDRYLSKDDLEDVSENTLPETVGDIDALHEKTFGNVPKEGDEIPNLADEINKDEEDLRG